VPQSDIDTQSQLTGYIPQANVSNVQSSQSANFEPSILRGVFNGSSAAGDKRSNTESVGSFMSRRQSNTCATTHRSQTVSHVNRSKHASNHIFHGTMNWTPTQTLALPDPIASS
jgi:hypothetical protein